MNSIKLNNIEIKLSPVTRLKILEYMSFLSCSTDEIIELDPSGNIENQYAEELLRLLNNDINSVYKRLSSADQLIVDIFLDEATDADLLDLALDM